ncbi:conserved hypothetical protein [Uncinocarpus reesii 1704]|uniref:Vacuolar protein sorting-associated protein 62 n=1 Tax=Uncinocarpus reesii (strain UAMH 1704) TaxID=336963 RepID=C4JF25_UNCRE|nr:uncharacterized protein UREG_00926 [Uncinocarpus reesii 1704]EEP76078.1 conserved hypothetical protein [Uncinocarpus reesii 1704]
MAFKGRGSEGVVACRQRSQITTQTENRLMNDTVAPQLNAGLQLPLISPVPETSPPLIHTTLSPLPLYFSPEPIPTLSDAYESSTLPDAYLTATALPTVPFDSTGEEIDEHDPLAPGYFLFSWRKSARLSNRVKSRTWNLLSRVSDWLYSSLTSGKYAPHEGKASKDGAVEHNGPVWQFARPMVEGDQQILHDIPDYVYEYSPLVHLYSGEQFWPGDIGEHLTHITPYLNYTPLRAASEHPLLDDLDELNNWQQGRYVFLTSDDNVESRPKWLLGRKNIPAPIDESKVSGYFGRKSKTGGRSSAPAVLIVIDKGDGIVDAFWFYFYSYNLGNMVLNVRFGNHVGDWEHSLVRFHHGEPKAIFLSEHAGGEAYTYNAVEKSGKRPVIYSATGTHAMYATPGIHAYILPWGLLRDRTDTGPLWDPALNLHAYIYSVNNDTLYPSSRTPHAPTEWFSFRGHWGDKIYPLSDDRQYRFAGQYHYDQGFKRLGRRKVCPGPEEGACIIRDEIMGKGGRKDVKAAGAWNAGLSEDDEEEDLIHD